MTTIGDETFKIDLGTYGWGNNRARVVQLGGGDKPIKMFYAHDLLIGLEFSITENSTVTTHKLFLSEEDIPRDRQRRMLRSIPGYGDIDPTNSTTGKIVSRDVLDKQFILMSRRAPGGVLAAVTAPTYISSKASDDGKSIEVTFSTNMNVPFNVENEFTIKIGDENAFNPVEVNPVEGEATKYLLVLPEGTILTTADESTKLSYTGEEGLRSVTSTANGILKTFSNQTVTVTGAPEPDPGPE